MVVWTYNNIKIVKRCGESWRISCAHINWNVPHYCTYWQVCCVHICSTLCVHNADALMTVYIIILLSNALPVHTGRWTVYISCELCTRDHIKMYYVYTLMILYILLCLHYLYTGTGEGYVMWRSCDHSHLVQAKKTHNRKRCHNGYWDLGHHLRCCISIHPALGVMSNVCRNPANTIH